jgi:hypothetical protein
MEWFIAEGEPRRAMRVASSLWLYWAVRGYIEEGLDWLNQLLPLVRNQPPHPDIAKALHGKLWSVNGPDQLQVPVWRVRDDPRQATSGPTARRASD